MSDEVKSKFDMFEVDEETGEVLVSEDMMEKALINPDEVLEALEEAFKEPEEGFEPKTVSDEEAVEEATGDAEPEEATEEAAVEEPSVAEEEVAEEMAVTEETPEQEDAAEEEESEDGMILPVIDLSEVEETMAEASEEQTEASEAEQPQEETGPEDADVLPVLDFDFNFGEEEFAETTENSEEDAILRNIDEALAAQMAATMGISATEEEKKKEKKKKNFWTRMPLWLRITMITLFSLCLILLLLVGTKPGRKIIYNLAASYLSDRFGDEPTPATTPTPPVATYTPTPEPTRAPNTTATPTPSPAPVREPRQEEYCYNVLLIGVEALPQLGGGSRSDTMILVSINSKEKKIHMTSFMRDMYLEIPGRGYDKLNAAYAHGGADLLIETLEKNFLVKIDGYAKVGFDSFEWIVDRLGGVEITLTAEEAEYLRTHNYISKKEYRNVVAGTQLMNGNQVLGYCRVRMVPNINGSHSDFGRTERQRIVLSKIFNKYKESNIFSMLSILNDCLPRVTTNVSKTDIQTLLETVVEERILSMDTMRIPISGGYSSTKVAGADVLAVYLDKNVDALHEFVFGPEE